VVETINAHREIAETAMQANALHRDLFMSQFLVLLGLSMPSAPQYKPQKRKFREKKINCKKGKRKGKNERRKAKEDRG
jgi:hypothetical protein